MKAWESFWSNNPVILEKMRNAESAAILDDIFSECELASYWVGVSLEDCAKKLDSISFK